MQKIKISSNYQWALPMMTLLGMAPLILFTIFLLLSTSGYELSLCIAAFVFEVGFCWIALSTKEVYLESDDIVIGAEPRQKRVPLKNISKIGEWSTGSFRIFRVKYRDNNMNKVFYFTDDFDLRQCISYSRRGDKLRESWEATKE